MGSDSPSVRRWRRYGQDRLYVTDVHGIRVGWWDLATDEPHPEGPERLTTLIAAVTEWRAGPAVATESSVALEPDPATIGMPEPVSTDLARNRPGAMAREQAELIRAGRPIRTVLARVLGLHTDERAWRIGAIGEEKVADQCKKLANADPRWRFVHAVPVGDRGSDIDHVVIGPGGVFTMNAKHHPRAKIWVGGDTLMVNGQRQPYVRNSRHEAQRASRLLSAACDLDVPVEGVIVPVRASEVKVKTWPDGVHVVSHHQVARWLRMRREVLDQARIDVIYEAARRPATWSRASS